MSSPSSSRRSAKQQPQSPNPATLPAQPPLFPQVSFGTQPEGPLLAPQPQVTSPPSRKRKASGISTMAEPSSAVLATGTEDPGQLVETAESHEETTSPAIPPKKSRTNTPWTPAEEQRLKSMRDAQSSWGEIAKTFPNRTEGSVKKHWYKDMHYAEFAEDEEAALLAAIKEYEASKWKVIGAKVGKPPKACEQYAREHFGGKI